MSVITPNMGLTQPSIGVDSGLSWEEAQNNNATIVDQHSHAPGYGVPIQPSGINLNSDLTFQDNAAIALKATVFTPQSSYATFNSLYCIGADLYYNDGSGNVIQVTSGGSVNATSSGISSGTATASFAAGVLVVNSAASTPANIQAGSILLGNNVASSKYLTLAPPNAMGANYTITLFSLPASTKFLSVDNTGNVAAAWAVDNSTLEISSNTLQVKNGGITNTKLAALGQQISSANNSQVDSSGSYVDVTNLSVSITTSGRPVFIGVVSANNGISSSCIRAEAVGSTATVSIGFRILRSGTEISQYQLRNVFPSASASNQINVPPGSIWHVDTPSANTYTYSLQMTNLSSNTQVGVQDVKLIAYEL